MQHGGSEQRSKGGRTTTHKRPKATTVGVFTTGFEEQVAILTRELKEAREQQTATAEVLRVISSSPSNLQPVFDSVLSKATDLSEASYGTLWLREADNFRSAAVHNLPPALAEARRREPVVPFARNTGVGRVLESRQTVHVADMSKDPAYLARNPRAVLLVKLGGARTVTTISPSRLSSRPQPPKCYASFQDRQLTFGRCLMQWRKMPLAYARRLMRSSFI